MSYSIRPATPDEVAIIARQRRGMFAEMGYTDYLRAEGMDEKFGEWLRPRMERGEYLGWFAVADEGAVVGGVGLWLRDGTPHPVDFSTQRGYIMNVFVEPEHRRRGLARLLLRALIAWCAEHEVRGISLHASDAGRPLYAALGFEDSNEMRLYLP